MCRPQCLLFLLALLVGVAQCWDLAITTRGQVEFYTNKTKVSDTANQHSSPTALAYEAAHNMLLFADIQSDNASIFSFHIPTEKYQPLVRKLSSEYIHGITFDPVTNQLFWIDTRAQSISFKSLKSRDNSTAYGKLWLQLKNDDRPSGIAVDSCRGYVYWSNANSINPTIERARLNGTATDIEVIASKNLHKPVTLAVDQRTRRLYWIDDTEGIYFKVQSCDLDAKSCDGATTTLYEGSDNHHPSALTVSKDSLYWIDSRYQMVFKMAKQVVKTEPETYIVLKNEMPFGIVANYPIKDQTEGIAECEVLRSFPQANTTNDIVSVSDDTGLFCVHGKKVMNKGECECHPGYIGTRCDTSVCHNFCFTGDCSIINGEPSCRCNEQFIGERCEVNICAGFCLNNGRCSINDEHKPQCSCTTDFQGTRCEAVKPLPTTTTTTEATSVSTTQKTETRNAASTAEPIPVTAAPKICNCKNESILSAPAVAAEASATDGEFVIATSCNDGWDAIRDPILMVLGVIVGLLVLTCVVLFTKILQLKKRPRIKKRIIVNKNVTPMTARPEQCEITIENCCNMNICETPCFEPRSTIRPTLLDKKPGKEEKKNLIANMEYPDDF